MGVKKLIKTFCVVFIYPILYFPYKALNAYVIVELFGSSSRNPKFNANNITDIFWVLVGVTMIILFTKGYNKNYGIKTKTIFFVVSVILLVLYSLWMTTLFGRSMYWD